MIKQMLPPGGRPQPGRAGKGESDSQATASATKPKSEVFVNQIRAVLTWPDGLDAPPIITPIGGSDVLDEQICTMLIRALKIDSRAAL